MNKRRSQNGWAGSPWHAVALPAGALGFARTARRGVFADSRAPYRIWAGQLLTQQRAEIGWLAHDRDLGGLMAVCKDRRALAN